MKTRTHSQRLALIACLMPVAVASAKPGTDRLYEVTTRMEMPGMPMQPPPQTTRVCAPATETSDKMLAGNDNCKVTDKRTSGNKTTYRMACTGEMPMTGEGEMEEFATGYRGRMSATMGAGGDRQILNMSYEGKLVGTCNYGTDGAAAKAAQMTAQHCDQYIDVYSTYNFYTDKDGMCVSRRAEFCANLAKNATPKFAAAGKYDPTVWAAFEACGQSRESVVARACDIAVKDGDVQFVQESCPARIVELCDLVDPLKDSAFVLANCPARAKAIAAEQCTGRSYTALRYSPYAAYCRGMAADSLQQRNAGAPAGAAGATMDVLRHGAALGIANGSSNAAEAAQAVGAASHMINAGQSGGDAADKTLNVIQAGSQVLPIGGENAGKIGAAAGLLKGAKSLGGLLSRKNKEKEEAKE